jgi:hypothetical protein
MPSGWDVSIKLLYAVDDGSYFTIDDVANGYSFDVIANVEIGEDLNQNVDSFDLSVSVRNLSQSSTLATEKVNGSLTPRGTSFNDEVRVDFDGGWTAEVGDVLQAVASYKVVAGANIAFSTADSNTFVVS